MQKRWILGSQDEAKARAIAAAHRLSPLIAKILINRQLTDPEAIQQYLQPSLAQLPDPLLLTDMAKAVERMASAIAAKELVTIYGDYDVDGTTSTAVLLTFLRQVGAHVDYYIPHRIKEGYSLNRGALMQLKARGSKVVITVDNGISAVAEAEVARELGIDLIITDHHEVPPDLPKGFAVINPKRSGDLFPGKELAGVGVAFFFLMALRKGLRERGVLGDREPNLKALLDLVAVGTIADMAPLRGVNRILVREGLKVLSASPRLGLRALMEVSAMGGKVSADQVAFRIGPRINAVGRLDDAALGVRLLLCTDRKEAQDLAQTLDQANRDRQDLEEKIVEEAVAQVLEEEIPKKFCSLVLFNQGWHAGVIGIVASRLVEKFYLPTIVLTKDGDFLKGSARSIRGLHLVETLRHCSSLLNKFGGHEYAAGLTLAAENLEPFIQKFDAEVRARLKPEDYIPALKAEGEADLDALTPDLMEQLETLEPFGLGNPEPLFLLKGALVQDSRIVGERHLKLKIGQGRRKMGGIGFRLADRKPSLQSKIDLIISPSWNEWQGSKTLEFRVSDLRPSEAL